MKCGSAATFLPLGNLPVRGSRCRSGSARFSRGEQFSGTAPVRIPDCIGVKGLETLEHERFRFTASAGGDVGHRTPGGDGTILGKEGIGVARLGRRLIFFSDRVQGTGYRRACPLNSSDRIAVVEIIG
jgi:hypothetical protein